MVIAYVAQQNVQTGIYTARTDGTQITPLLKETADIAFPDWSPDGNKIAFIYEKTKLHVMNADASERLLLSSDLVVGPDMAWSPDSQKIAFSAVSPYDGRSNIFTVNADGSDLTNLTLFAPSRVSATGPVWSSDGQYIAFVSAVDARGSFWRIYTMKADGTELRQFKSDAFQELSPQWSPQGNHILFDSDDQLFLMDVDGSNRKQLTNTEAKKTAPVWSPDGYKVAYFAFENQYDTQSALVSIKQWIYLLNMNDSYDQTAVVSAEARDRVIGYPSWSPDGRFLAFTMVQDGNRNLYIADICSNMTSLVVPNVLDYTPSWKPQ